MLKLHKYQNNAVDFIMKHKQVFLAMDMGLGKTATVLTAIDRMKIPAVVFGPLQVILNSWPDEIQKWTPHLTYKVLHGKNKNLDDIDQYDILLINYEGLKWLSEQSVPWKRRALVLDESSMIKSPSTSRFSMFKKSFPLWTDIRICLSATPAPNSLNDLWSQYYMLDQGQALGKNITTFRNDYCQKVSFPGMPVVLYEFDPRFTQHVYDQVAPVTYRLDAKDYLDMPDLIHNEISCELTPKLKKQYKELEKDFVLELETGDIEVDTSSVLSMKLRQFIQGGIYDHDRKWQVLHKIKLQTLQRLVETTGTPILCAIQFKGELQQIREVYPDVPVIAGQTSTDDSRKYIKEWNLGKIPLLLCHPASLSHGVNLQTGGHILLWYGLTWSLEQYQQLIGRLYRQGQLSAVVVHHLIMQGTIDTKVYKVLQRKGLKQGDFLGYLRNLYL